MQSLQKFSSPNKRTPHIDFKPAKLKKQSNDNWIIVFYWKPINGSKMKRFRRRVKYMSSKKDRVKYAKIKIAHLNTLLESGWSPIDDRISFTGSFIDVMDLYLEACKKKYANDKLRFDTLRTNSSFINSIKLYLDIYKMQSMDCKLFTRKFVLDYLEHKEYKDKVSQRTINNHLSFMFTLNKYMIDKEMIDTNVVIDIPTRKINSQKIRQRIPEETKQVIFNHIKEKSTAFYTLCLMTYLCFIRRTEITKLKVKNIDLAQSLIKVPASISKSKKDGYVTIPSQYTIILARHIKYSDPEDFIFSHDKFEPGQVQMKPRKISDYWYSIRKKLELPVEYQFYSLKDTGITENFEKGIPAIKIRDQARHENISTTEMYAPKKQKADDTIRNIYYNL